MKRRGTVMQTDTNNEEIRTRALFMEIFRNLPRAGPGDPASTRRALELMPRLPRQPRVLDVGCGPGAGTLELANLTGGRVTAFDLHLPFVARLSSRAKKAGVAGRIAVLCADMRTPPFPAESFDLVWSEGALYGIGFPEGLAVCRDLTRPGGYVAASEAVWTVPNPPGEVRQWWEDEYPAIASILDKSADVVRAGLELVGHFTLPSSAWLEHYYAPMRERLAQLRREWADDPAGIRLIQMHEHEIGMYERFGHAYGYEFFVATRPKIRG